VQGIKSERVQANAKPPDCRKSVKQDAEKELNAILNKKKYAYRRDRIIGNRDCCFRFSFYPVK
jgi:hypothetical protein